MRVLKVLPGVSPDAGTERSLQAMAPGMIALGVELHLVLLTPRQSLVPVLERMGVIVHDLSSQRGLIGRVRALREVIAAVRPDVIHASLFEATVPTQLAVIGTGIPVLISWANTVHLDRSAAEPGPRRWKLVGVQVVESVLGRLSGSRYHAVTPAVGRINAAAQHVDPSRVFVGERGRDPRRFERSDRRPPRLPAEVPCGPHLQVLLAVGRQEPQKGYETLLAAFDRLAATHPDAVLLLAGRDGSSTPALRRAQERMVHGGRVHFLGQRDDVADLMGHADVVVSSSWREGAAGALIEAMACETPIVSVPIAGLDGILVDRENAVVVPRDELASGISLVLDDPELGAKLANAARVVFEERFTIDSATSRMVEIYREVADRG